MRSGVDEAFASLGCYRGQTHTAWPLNMGINRTSRNVADKLPTYAVWHPQWQRRPHTNSPRQSRHIEWNIKPDFFNCLCSNILIYSCTKLWGLEEPAFVRTTNHTFNQPCTDAISVRYPSTDKYKVAKIYIRQHENGYLNRYVYILNKNIKKVTVNETRIKTPPLYARPPLIYEYTIR